MIYHFLILISISDRSYVIARNQNCRVGFDCCTIGRCDPRWFKKPFLMKTMLKDTKIKNLLMTKSNYKLGFVILTMKNRFI